jgi:hypothetical protein
VLNLSDKMKTAHLLKDGMSLAEAGWHYGKNESSTFSVQDKEHEVRSSFR